jgi:hypothetical protein
MLVYSRQGANDCHCQDHQLVSLKRKTVEVAVLPHTSSEPPASLLPLDTRFSCYFNRLL